MTYKAGEAISQGPTMAHEVLRIEEDGSRAEEIQVVLEEPLAIQVNGQEVAVLMRLPGHEKELAAGFCLSEGLIGSMADVLLIHHCGRDLPAPAGEEDALGLAPRNQVQVHVRQAAWQRGRTEEARLIRSGCGAVGIQPGDLNLPVVQSDLKVPAPVLLSLNAAMRENQGLFRDVGAVHAAAVFDAQGELVVLREDIGRHNAVDKALGYCLLRGIALADKIMATTGRASYEMVSKAVRAGIPTVASVSSPTSLAIQVAEAQGCTLIGYMRGRRFSIYTHAQRVH